MFKNLRIDPDQKKLINLPEGWITLFMAKTTGMYGFRYATIVCPEKAYLPAKENHFQEIGGEAKLILFTLENVRVYDVRHGHKYSHGGGMVEVDSDDRGATWTTSDECGHNIVFGHRIPPADVLIAL